MNKDQQLDIAIVEKSQPSKRVLMISTDRKILEAGSSVRKRMQDYAEKYAELHIILFATKNHLEALGVHDDVVRDKNIFIYPTASFSKILYIFDAWRIGKRLIEGRGHENGNENAIDEITCQDPFETALVGVALLRSRNKRLDHSSDHIRLELQAHTDFTNTFFTNHTLLNFLRVFMAGITLPKADHIRVVSKRIEDGIVRDFAINRAKISVRPINIPSESYKNATIADENNVRKLFPYFKKTVLMASRLTKEKGILSGLDIFYKASIGHDDIGLIIVGDGPLKGQILDKAKSLGIENRVKVLGWKNDLASFYKSVDLFFNNSLYEGYGMTLIEASACGCQILTSDVGIASELASSGRVESGQKIDIFDVGNTRQATVKMRYFLGVKVTDVVATLAPRVLIITQKMNMDDSVLSFFHRWTEVFAKNCKKITLICLEKGRYSLPGNVEVFSLGKESRPTDLYSRLIYVFRFYKIIWSKRNDFDQVFIHMNQEYVLLGAPLFKLWGQKIYMWRNHHAGSFLTKLAGFLSDEVFCPSRYSYTASFRNARIMPVGIDTELYKPVFGQTPVPALSLGTVPVSTSASGSTPAPKSILFMARISPSKNPDILIEAMKILVKRAGRFDYKVDIIGDALPEHRNYYQKLKEAAISDGLHAGEISFSKGLSFLDTPLIFSSHEMTVNLSSSGMFDKTILEAMACGSLSISSNKNLKGLIDGRLVLEKNDATILADTIEAISKLSAGEKSVIIKNNRDFVVNQHSLGKLAEMLFLA